MLEPSLVPRYWEATQPCRPTARRIDPRQRTSRPPQPMSHAGDGSHGCFGQVVLGKTRSGARRERVESSGKVEQGRERAEPRAWCLQPASCLAAGNGWRGGYNGAGCLLHPRMASEGGGKCVQYRHQAGTVTGSSSKSSRHQRDRFRVSTGVRRPTQPSLVPCRTSDSAAARCKPTLPVTETTTATHSSPTSGSAFLRTRPGHVPERAD